jgi:hypothetical protein
MQKLWITVLLMWLVWAGCGASNAQQAKKAQPAQSQSDSGPSLQETLTFLNNSFQGGMRADLMPMCHGRNGNTVAGGWNYITTLDTSMFPVISFTSNGSSFNAKGDPLSSTDSFSIDLRRVDPQGIHVNKMESTDQGDGWSCEPHMTTVFLILQGTNGQSISSAGVTFSSAQTLFSSEEVANRVANAMRRAVVLAGGKPSAF